MVFFLKETMAITWKNFVHSSPSLVLLIVYLFPLNILVSEIDLKLILHNFSTVPFLEKGYPTLLKGI
jgi:hypothetical protein